MATPDKCEVCGADIGLCIICLGCTHDPVCGSKPEAESKPAPTPETKPPVEG